MPRKILRDLEKRGSKTVYLVDENLHKPVPEKKENILDLSEIGKQKFVITGAGKKLVKDIVKIAAVKGIHEEAKSEQVFFLQIDAEKKYRPDRINETIRMAAAGALILFVINLVNVYHRGIIVKDSVIASAADGYEDLLEAGKQAQGADFKGAEGTFNDANENFEAALSTINFLRGSQQSFFTREKTVDTVNGLLEAAKNLSLAGKDFSRGVENLKRLPELFLQENGQQIFSFQTADSLQKSLTEKLKEDITFIDKATVEVETARKNLAKVSPEALPSNLKNKLGFIRQKVNDLLEILHTTQEKIPAVLNLLGDRYPHRYLILLQNDTEARPTGGFIGSYMLVDLNDGYITKMEFRDVYETDGLLKEEIPAPEDIAKITKYWRMRDSNYSPDFAVSGEKAAWFLQKEKGPSVDSVIAVNQSMLADLLAVTGPIQLSSLRSPLDQNNYQIVLSYLIESKTSGVENPKKVLGEFIQAFRDKLFTSEKWQDTILTLIQAYRQKKVLMYSRHQDVQKMFDQFGMSGRVIRTRETEDYLNVVVTSIGGNKSDAYMEQHLYHNTLIDNNGLLTDEITIVRRHDWTPEDISRWQSILRPFGFEDISDTVKDILGRGENKSSIKIYVPRGSVLIDSYGLEKEKVLTRDDGEIDKTYFMFELAVKPGEEKKITLSYQLPEKLRIYPVDTYKFFAQNQPAMHAGQFEKKIFFKPGLQSYRQFPESLKKNDSGQLYYAGRFDGDVYISALVGT